MIQHKKSNVLENYKTTEICLNAKLQKNFHTCDPRKNLEKQNKMSFGLKTAYCVLINSINASYCRLFFCIFFLWTKWKSKLKGSVGNNTIEGQTNGLLMEMTNYVQSHNCAFTYRVTTITIILMQIYLMFHFRFNTCAHSIDKCIGPTANYESENILE